MAKLEAGKEIEPPWVAFPVSLASFGWGDGDTERWKLEIWLPFWNRLSEIEKKEYLERWQPPNSKWLENFVTNLNEK